MAKTELKLKSTNAATGQNITTTIGYVNPTADSQTLKTFGQKLNAFTTNTYGETDRVQTINVDTEQVVLPKQDQTIQVGEWTTKSTPHQSYLAATIQAQGVIGFSARTINSGETVRSGIGPAAGDDSIFSDNEIYVMPITGGVNVTIVASGNSEYNGSSIVSAAMPS